MNRALACENEYSRRLTDAERAEQVKQARAIKIAERFDALWADPEVLSEVVTDLPALLYRRAYFSSAGYRREDKFTGIAALTALRDSDHAEFGRLVYKACVDAVQAKAADMIDDEAES